MSSGECQNCGGDVSSDGPEHVCYEDTLEGVTERVEALERRVDGLCEVAGEESMSETAPRSSIRRDSEVDDYISDLVRERDELRRSNTMLQDANNKLVGERRGSRRARVREFFVIADQKIAEECAVPEDASLRLGLRLVAEEFFEMLEASFGGLWTGHLSLSMKYVMNAIDHAPIQVNFPELADALADVDYVVEGVRVRCGIDGEPIEAAVHKANLTKKDGPKDEHGKKCKPPNWQPADIGALLRAQGWRG